MKLITCALLIASVGAFTPTPTSSSSISTISTTSLNLFGGGGKKDAAPGGGGGAGMMGQLAMFKKAQEMAQKKQAIDKELSAMTFEGKSEGDKVKAIFKFVPVTNPMDPNPDYEATSFEFDDDFFSSATPEELSAATKEAIIDGIKVTSEAVMTKYATLQGDLMEAIGGLKGPGQAKPE